MNADTTGVVRILWLILLGAPTLMLLGCGAAPVADTPPAEESALSIFSGMDTSGISSTNAGQIAESPPPVVAPFVAGDIDGNGLVDLADKDEYIVRFEAAFGATDGSQEYDPLLEMDGDGLIGWSDLQIFLSYMDAN